MKVLVDTSVWSLALRRRKNAPGGDPFAGELARLVQEGRAAIAGPIRQEILSGIAEQAQFRRLRDRLSSFPDERLLPADFVAAAELHNQCRRKGVQGSHIDFLLCAVAIRLDMPIFTTDADFAHYARHVPIKVHEVRTPLRAVE